MNDEIFERIKARLARLYPLEQAKDCYQELFRLIQICGTISDSNKARWNEQDVILITYGDSFIDAEGRQAPLTLLNRFLAEHLQNAVNTLHILPFFPYSSDDGFSVIDYVKVDPDLGDWSDIQALHQNYDLMLDLVINHISRESLWFTDYKADITPYNQFFIEVEKDTDVSMVVRPRSHPLLVPAYTHRGRKWVWATFSPDQIDLNFANPAVLIKMIEVLMFYIKQNARIIRLDAIAFLWKQLGTPSIHLPQTHEIVKLLRDILSLIAPHAILLTETNVPHNENLSYFGQQDEAHLVYQFSLAPLVLHALYTQNGHFLTHWAQQLRPPALGCNFLNFIASHDGIGLRPVEGLLPETEIANLIQGMRDQGGYISMRTQTDGSQVPYEINIALFSACAQTQQGEDDFQVERFLCSQLIILTLQGLPALYIHSLIASENDQAGVELTGRTRSINRKKWPYDDINQRLNDPNSPQAQVLTQLKQALQQRRHCPAFHPDIDQKVIDLGKDFFIIWRGRQDLDAPLLAVFNLTPHSQTLDPSHIEDLPEIIHWRDLLAQQQFKYNTHWALAPYQVLWLVAE